MSELIHQKEAIHITMRIIITVCSIVKYLREENIGTDIRRKMQQGYYPCHLHSQKSLLAVKANWLQMFQATDV